MKTLFYYIRTNPTEEYKREINKYNKVLFNRTKIDETILQFCILNPNAPIRMA